MFEKRVATDPYKELGVARGASQDELRKAFRKLAKENHPDRNPGDKKAEERFKRVAAAFDLLGDPDKRARFDRGEIDADGRDTFRGFNPGGSGGSGGSPFGAGGRFEGVDLEDIFDMFGGVGGVPRGGPRSSGPAKGHDVRARLEIDLEDSIVGATKRIAFSDGRTLDVTIPQGASDGQVLRLKGQGAPARAGGQPGDALIELGVKPHPVFRREGGDLHMDLPVSVPDAVLGGKVQAPTPDGTVSLNVPKGANSGSMLRLKGRGAVDPRTRQRGDLFARLIVTLPDGPDPALEAFAEKWRKERPYAPKRR
nr:J domain-containing protein [Caulobacter sp. 17J65-9]